MECPPFRHWLRVILRGPVEQTVQNVAFDMATVLRDAVEQKQLAIRVLGPAPCPVARVQGSFRFHFLLSAIRRDVLRSLWLEVRPQLPTDRNVDYVVDMDPLNLR